MPEPSILVGVGGGIAAYKAADVVSGLRKRGAKVTVLLSRNAHHFVAPLTLKTLSGRPVGQDLFAEPAEWGVGHVTLAKEADAFLMKRGLILRQVSSYGLPDHLRLTIGTEEANRLVVKTLAEFMSAGK